MTVGAPDGPGRSQHRPPVHPPPRQPTNPSPSRHRALRRIGGPHQPVTGPSPAHRLPRFGITGPVLPSPRRRRDHPELPLGFRREGWIGADEEIGPLPGAVSSEVRFLLQLPLPPEGGILTRPRHAAVVGQLTIGVDPHEVIEVAGQLTPSRPDAFHDHRRPGCGDDRPLALSVLPRRGAVAHRPPRPQWLQNALDQQRPPAEEALPPREVVGVHDRHTERPREPPREGRLACRGATVHRHDPGGTPSRRHGEDAGRAFVETLQPQVVGLTAPW